MENINSCITFAQWAINEKMRDGKIYGKLTTVRNLNVGDIVLPTKCKVLNIVYSSIKFPSDKIQVTVQYPKGKIVTTLWNKSTSLKIAVE